MAKVKIDDELHKRIKKLIKQGENRFDFPTAKSFVSMIVAPIMAGTDSRNEYLKAVALSIFLSNPVATVTPFLETPGIMATP